MAVLVPTAAWLETLTVPGMAYPAPGTTQQVHKQRGAMEDEERSRKIEYGRAIAAAWRRSRAADAMEDEERQRKIEYGRAIVEVWRLSQPSDAMEDKERRRKIEYARAKLAQYRQRIAQFDGQTTKKSKKVSSCKEDEHSSNINEHADEVFKNVSQGVETNGNPDCTELILFPSGQANKHNQVLAELYEFEAVRKQQYSIITQLTAHLQQSRKETDEMINEMITESKEKLQIQLQHVSETLQSSTHSTTAEELVLVKQQVHALHQQLEKQNHLLLDYQKKEGELKTEVTLLQEKIKEQDKKLENNNIQELEKQAIIEDLQETIKEEGNKSAALQNELETADKLVGDLKKQLREKDQETQSLKLELANCKEKEKHYILEIEEFKGRVEELQKKDYKDNHTDTGKEQSTERETRRKVDHLQVELDEMYGREIMHMKEQLIRQNKSKMEDLKSRHEGEMETILASYACTTLGMCNMYREYKEQLDLLNVIINGQDVKLQDTLSQKENLSKELCLVKREKDVLESQFNDLLEEYNVLRYQTITDHNKISQQESKLNDTYHSLHIVKAEIATMSDFLKEVECKHEKEITKYKIKLEMLEKEKNEIVKEMSESQEAQMQLLQLSHEEDLYKLKEDLEAEHQINVEKLKENLALHHKHQIEELENEMCKKIEILQCEKDNFLSEDKEPIQVLIGRLQKALSEECCSVSKSMQAFLDETYCPLNCEMNIEEKENSFVYHAISRVNLQDYRYQVEEFQDAIQNLLSKVTDEHNKFVILQMQLSKIHGQQTDGAKLEFAEENVAEEESGILSVRSQAGLESTDTDIIHESELSSLPEGEDSKNHEKQLQVLESPVDTLEQQLKATKAHYGTEIPTVQGSIETIHGPSAHPSVDSMVFKGSDSQKTVCCGNCRPDHVIIIIEPEEMLESFTQNQEKTESLWCLDDLSEHQQEQPRSREQPAVHLNKAESIIDGNLDERILLEGEIQENACTIDHLEQELLCMSGRVPKFEEEQQQIQEERSLLSRQKEAMGAGAGPVQQRPADVEVDAAPGAENLNKGHMDPEQLHIVPMKSVGMAADELQADALQPEDVSAQDSSELLQILTPVGGLKQNCKGYRSLEAQLLTLEQGKSKPELLQKKINILQYLLVEKIAEATVNQAQMEAFQQYMKYFQEKRTSEPEMRDRHNVNPLKGDNTVIDIYTLTMRLGQLENQIAGMSSSFIKEKQQCEITEKRVSDIEKVLKLQMPLGEVTTKTQDIKENERILQDLDISETRSDLIHAGGDRGFLDELEAHGAGSVSHKEQDLIKNKQTAMKSFWVVNMESLWNVSIKLTEGLRKLKITH